MLAQPPRLFRPPAVAAFEATGEAPVGAERDHLEFRLLDEPGQECLAGAS
jgi:hypothetical protein